MTSQEPEPGIREGVEDIDKLVHEPARLLLMAQLYVVEEADFVFLLDRTGLTAGNVSSHMKKLVGAGYVEVEKAFVRNRPQTSYRLSTEGRAAFERYRDTIADIVARLPR
ncbi:MAG: transcriptional regulator [Gemmatimonadota bacterium]|jgi:DNA-binding MarR family transcriptional regulator